MKKALLSLSLLSTLLISVFLVPVKIFAQGAPSAVVSGVVIRPDFTLFGGIPVTIYCLHNGAYEIHNTTTGTGETTNGYFESYYYGDTCALGDHVWATAGSGGLNGIADAFVVLHSQLGIAIIQLFTSEQAPQNPPAIVPPPSVPEFGLITGVLALAISAGSFKLLRK